MVIRSGICLLLSILVCVVSVPPASAGEKILYRINPFGKSEFTDEGIVAVDGKQLRVSRFRTRVIGFDDNEKIYSDPSTGLPVWVERNVHWPFSKEYITEDYDKAHFTMVMRKYRYKGGKLIEEHTIRQDGPIYSAILFPFTLRNVTDPQIGWTVKTAFPNEFMITLESIDEVRVPAGRFKAYHFVSEPKRFELWISQDRYRIPVKIQGHGDFCGYTMKLHDYFPEGQAK